MDPAKIVELEQRLGHTFASRLLLLEALTHSSYVAEHVASPVRDNQRLEFLGDAVLQIVVTDQLFRRYPDLEEGALTRLRSLLAIESTLVRMAQVVNLGPCLHLGRGERLAGDPRPSILADAFEALLGALYLDAGFPCVREFLEGMMEAVMPDPLHQLDDENPKGRLQELTQDRFGSMPDYEVLNITGPDHKPEFEVAVRIRGEVVARAQAGNRQQAEKEAARLALEELRKEAEAAAASVPPG